MAAVLSVGTVRSVPGVSGMRRVGRVRQLSGATFDRGHALGVVMVRVIRMIPVLGVARVLGMLRMFRPFRLRMGRVVTVAVPLVLRMLWRGTHRGEPFQEENRLPSDRRLVGP